MDIRVTMDDVTAERFLRIKEHLGFRNDTDVLRTLVDEYFERLSTSGKEAYALQSLEGMPDAKDARKMKGQSISREDREFVRDELSWLAEWIKKRYPGLNLIDARRILREVLSASV